MNDSNNNQEYTFKPKMSFICFALLWFIGHGMIRYRQFRLHNLLAYVQEYLSFLETRTPFDSIFNRNSRKKFHWTITQQSSLFFSLNYSKQTICSTLYWSDCSVSAFHWNWTGSLESCMYLCEVMSMWTDGMRSVNRAYNCVVSFDICYRNEWRMWSKTIWILSLHYTESRMNASNMETNIRPM